MTSRDFCYWLQGYLEIAAADGAQTPTDVGLSAPKVEAIQRHLALVFRHEIDPSFPPEQQGALNAIHMPPYAGPPHLKPAPPGQGGAGDVVMRC